jgi:hypothetical protein
MLEILFLIQVGKLSLWYFYLLLRTFPYLCRVKVRKTNVINLFSYVIFISNKKSSKTYIHTIRIVRQKNLCSSADGTKSTIF